MSVIPVAMGDDIVLDGMWNVDCLPVTGLSAAVCAALWVQNEP